MMNIMNGGKHAAGASGHAGVHGHACRRVFLSRRRLRWGVEIYHSLKKVLSKKGTPRPSATGRLASVSANSEAIELILEAIREAGYVVGEQIMLAMDPAASEFYEDGKYHLKVEGKS
jgi:enolase